MSNSEHSYGCTYAAERLDISDASEPAGSNQYFVIKTPRIATHLPDVDVDLVLAELYAKFQHEYQHRGVLADLHPSVARIRGLGLYRAPEVGMAHSKREITIPFLVSDLVDELNMEQFFEGTNQQQHFAGIQNPDDWFAIATKIIDILRRAHNRQLIHGELSPRSILLRQDESGVIEPILVDFGRAYELDMTSLSGSRIRRHDPYVAPECREKSMGWYPPAEIFALGGVLYYMATGQAPPDMMRQRDLFPTDNSWASATTEVTDSWKARIHSGFSANAGLMAGNEGIVKVIDKCLRPRPDDRYASAERVLHALMAMNNQRRHRTPEIGAKLDHLKVLWEQMNAHNCDDLFTSMFDDKLDLIDKEVSDMLRGHYELVGEREELIDTLIKYMGVLRHGDVYVTVTVPEYWTEENLGVNGRFLTINKDLVRNGVKVNRVFLISKEDLEDPSALGILSAHYRAWNSLPQPLRGLSPSFDHTGNGQMYVGFLLLSSREEVRKLQKQASHVAVWSREDDRKQMSIHFWSRPKYVDREGQLVQAGSQIVKVRFRQLDGNHEYQQLAQFFRDEDVKPLWKLAQEHEGIAPGAVFVEPSVGEE